MNIKSLLLTIILSIPVMTHASEFPSHTKYDFCFTPGNDCTGIIVTEIGKARKSIDVQAFVFTSTAIEQSLADAKTNGIDVKIILDKTEENKSAIWFREHDIPVWIDYRPAISHNKVIIIDEYTVITGSFNFTVAAQERNAENVLIIHDAGLARGYLANWEKRRDLSRGIS
jgi:phosphatidylserine/phosphatidylglycerophosphate/cardiolipin synthase-like enzyme